MNPILIPKPDLFSFHETLWFLDRNHSEFLYRVNKNSVTRLIEIEGQLVILRITENDAYLEAVVLNTEDFDHQ